MLVFRNGDWHTVKASTDPMLSYTHRQRLAVAIFTGGLKAETEFYKELFPGLTYKAEPQESFGKSIAPQSTKKNSAV